MSTHYRRAAPPSSIILFASIKSQGKVRERSRKGSEWSRNGSGEAAERRRRGGGSLLEQGSGESPPPCSAAGTTGSPKRKANFAKPSSAWKAVAPPQGKAGFQALKTVPFFSPSSHGQLAKLSNALAATCCAVQLPAPIVIGNKKWHRKSSPRLSALSSLLTPLHPLPPLPPFPSPLAHPILAKILPRRAPPPPPPAQPCPPPPAPPTPTPPPPAAAATPWRRRPRAPLRCQPTSPPPLLPPRPPRRQRPRAGSAISTHGNEMAVKRPSNAKERQWNGRDI